MKTLCSLVKNAYFERTAIAFIIGSGTYAVVHKVAERDLARDLSENQKAFWRESLSDPPEPCERVIMHVMRTEKNGFLALIEKDLSMENLLSEGMEKPRWQNNIFRQKAALDANKLMLCEDFQQTISCPALRVERIG